MLDTEEKIKKTSKLMGQLNMISLANGHFRQVPVFQFEFEFEK